MGGWQQPRKSISRATSTAPTFRITAWNIAWARARRPWPKSMQSTFSKSRSRSLSGCLRLSCRRCPRFIASAPRALGFDLFLDYVHPTKGGNHLVAETVFNKSIKEAQGYFSFTGTGTTLLLVCLVERSGRIRSSTFSAIK